MIERAWSTTELTIDEMPWQNIKPPPNDLPYDDGDKMESPWHFGNAALLVANYVASQSGRRDFYIGANMFVYFSEHQLRNQDYRGPDVFIVKDVDGTRERLSWIVWEERGRYPDVIFELLSASTAENDLLDKKTLYERTFRTAEYFCVAPEVQQLMGWRLNQHLHYDPIPLDERGWLWSEQLGLWLGAWHGPFFAETHTWLRFYRSDGQLVLLSDEAAQEQAEAERLRAKAAQKQAEAAQEQAKSERLRAEAAQEQAEAAQEQAEAERLRAEAAQEQAEAERLRAETAQEQAEAERLRAETAQEQAEAESLRANKAEKQAAALAAELEALKAQLARADRT